MKFRYEPLCWLVPKVQAVPAILRILRIVEDGPISQGAIRYILYDVLYQTRFDLRYIDAEAGALTSKPYARDRKFVSAIVHIPGNHEDFLDTLTGESGLLDALSLQYSPAPYKILSNIPSARIWNLARLCLDILQHHFCHHQGFLLL